MYDFKIYCWHWGFVPSANPQREQRSHRYLKKKIIGVFYPRKSGVFLKWKIGLRGQMVTEPHPEWAALTHDNKTVMGEAFSHQPICMHKKTHTLTHTHSSSGVKMRQLVCAWQKVSEWPEGKVCLRSCSCFVFKMEWWIHFPCRVALLCTMTVCLLNKEALVCVSVCLSVCPVAGQMMSVCLSLFGDASLCCSCLSVKAGTTSLGCVDKIGGGKKKVKGK